MAKKILTALLSLAVSFGLWVYVVSIVSPEWEETYRDIPVVFSGESVLEDDRNLMLICEQTPTVTLHLSGNRSDLSKLSSANITVTVDLSKVYEAGTPELTYNISYPGNVPNTAVTVLNRNPSGVKVEIVERVVKNVPVEVDYLGTLGDEYIKDKPETDVQTVQIKGPKSVVDQITSARVQVRLDGVTETIVDTCAYTLCDADGDPVDAKHVDTDVAFIQVTQPVYKVKEIPLKLDVIYGGGANEKNTKITMEYETIFVAGSESQLEGLNELLLGQIDLNQLMEDTVLTFPITLQEGISNETGITEVKVTVDMPELETRTIKVTAIAAINTPDGMDVAISTQEIDVVVRGTASQLDGLTEQDLTVVIDFTGMPAGTDRFDATVTVSSRFPDVGVVGTYTVLATLTEVN